MNCHNMKSLIDQYIDGILEQSQKEKVRDHLAQCPDCQDYYLTTKKLKQSLESFASEEAPDDMTDRIMASIHSKEVSIKSSWRHRLQKLFYIPRHPVHLVGATAAVLLVLFLAINPILLSWYNNNELINEKIVRVDFTLEIDKDNVRSVAVVGEFNDWNPNANLLQPCGNDGKWSLTLELEPGRYEYMYVLNGETWMTDPGAFQYNRDGFGNKNAVIDLSICS